MHRTDQPFRAARSAAAFSYRPSVGFLTALALLLASLHAILAVTASAGKSTTVDEIGHLTAGLTYNLRGDFRYDPANGNLPQRWAALPMAIAHVQLPPTSEPSWSGADVWAYGYAFFYQHGLSSDEFLWLGRAMISLVSAGIGLLVFFWSRNLFGWRGGFVSLTLFAFSPTFLAHGALATSDLVITFFFLAAVGAFWRHLEKPGLARAGISAVTLGLAFVAKFSAVLLPPMLAIIALGWAGSRGRKPGEASPAGRLVRTAIFHGITVWLIIWAFYDFRYSAFSPAFSPGSLAHDLRATIAGRGWPADLITPLLDHSVLPEAWLVGLTQVIQNSHARGAFLNGEYSVTGWVSFFPFAFLLKTTLPFLLICLLVFGSALRSLAVRRRSGRLASAIAWLRPVTPLAVLFCVYGAFSLTSHLNIGHRHLLPIYPVLFIAAGSLGRWLKTGRPFAAAVVLALVSWHGFESWRIRPHYLAYFNPLAGGPGKGWRHLVDSSLDWGQDLPQLKSWLQQHNRQNEPVYLSYFGSGDPAYEGLEVRRLYCLTLPLSPSAYVPLGPGIYCISATILVQVYSPTAGKWTSELEQEYQLLRGTEPLLSAYATDASRREELNRLTPPERWQQLTDRHEILRLARLCEYLKLRRPDGDAGYSILIYRLSADEVQRATGSTEEWRALIEQSAAQNP